APARALSARLREGYAVLLRSREPRGRGPRPGRADQDRLVAGRPGLRSLSTDQEDDSAARRGRRGGGAGGGGELAGVRPAAGATAGRSGDRPQLPGRSAEVNTQVFIRPDVRIVVIELRFPVVPPRPQPPGSPAVAVVAGGMGLPP